MSYGRGRTRGVKSEIQCTTGCFVYVVVCCKLFVVTIVVAFLSLFCRCLCCCCPFRMSCVIQNCDDVHFMYDAQAGGTY